MTYLIPTTNNYTFLHWCNYVLRSNVITDKLKSVISPHSVFIDSDGHKGNT